MNEHTHIQIKGTQIMKIQNVRRVHVFDDRSPPEGMLVAKGGHFIAKYLNNEEICIAEFISILSLLLSSVIVINCYPYRLLSLLMSARIAICRYFTVIDRRYLYR